MTHQKSSFSGDYKRTIQDTLVDLVFGGDSEAEFYAKNYPQDYRTKEEPGLSGATSPAEVIGLGVVAKALKAKKKKGLKDIGNSKAEGPENIPEVLKPQAPHQKFDISEEDIPWYFKYQAK